jgi:hypothetical protein
MTRFQSPTVRGLALAVFLVVSLVVATGCESLRKSGKHWRSSWRGLDRTITVYTADGRVLHRWNAKAYVEVRPGVVAFLDSAGKENKNTGGIVVVREK